MLQILNAGAGARTSLDKLESGGELNQAYRDWADSFGLTSPTPVFQRLVPDENQQKILEYYFKTIVTAEALGAVGLDCNSSPTPTEQHWQEMLRVAFHSDRTRDVYSDANRALCCIEGTNLELGPIAKAWSRITRVI